MKKIAKGFTIISNVAVTTRVSINKKGADLFIKGIFKVAPGEKIAIFLKKLKN